MWVYIFDNSQATLELVSKYNYELTYLHDTHGIAVEADDYVAELANNCECCWED